MFTRLGVGLRPLLPGDLLALRTIELSSRNLTRWRFAGEVPSPDEYRRLLWSGVLEQRVVALLDSPEPIGLVNVNRVDLRSGTGWLGVVEREDLHGQGHGLAGLALFIDWLFDQWPLRALYAEVHEANLGQFSSVLDGFAVIAGRLRDRFRGQGSLHAAVLLTIQREAWLKTARPRIRTTLVDSLASNHISFEEVCRIAADHGADILDAATDTGLEEIGLDSLAVILTLDAVEQQLGRPLPTGPDLRLRTLGDVWEIANLRRPA